MAAIPELVNDSANQIGVGILLPISLEQPSAWQGLTEFARSFATAFALPRGKSLVSASQQHRQAHYCFYVGVDLSPAEIEEEKASNHISELFNRVLGPYRSQIHFSVFCVPTGSVFGQCQTRAFRELARAAFRDTVGECEYFMLATEDIRFKESSTGSTTFINDLNNAFRDFAERCGETPHGVLGCACILDETMPSTPSIPIIHRTHLEMFDGDLLPSEVVDEGEDELDGGHLQELMFEIHFRFGAAKLLKHTRATRHSHVEQVLRPAAEGVELWTRFIKPTVDVYEAHVLERKRVGLIRNIALDVVVPSFRTPKHVIERIIRLPRPNELLSIRIVVVCDNPTSPEALKCLAELEREFEEEPACKFRVNRKNVGPGQTRTHGLFEALGDYVLFLDDDVYPEPGLFYEYAKMIKRFPLAPGFIGRTALPEPTNPRQHGFIRSRIAFGWDFAVESKTDVAWGITANLCVKRDPTITFDSKTFPKGGGGEDVDYCIRLAQAAHERIQRAIPLRSPQEGEPAALIKRNFIPAPTACVRHPWWDGGNMKLQHFVCWAKGDRPLIERHPFAAFWNIPDTVETSVALLTVGPLLVAMKAMRPSTLAAAIAAQPLGEFIYELISMRHMDLASTHGLLYMLRTAYYSAVISLCHEYGRFRGHVDRGILFSSFGKHFNWYAGTSFRVDFPLQERLRLLRRTICRWICALVLYKAMGAIDLKSIGRRANSIAESIFFRLLPI